MRYPRLNGCRVARPARTWLDLVLMLLSLAIFVLLAMFLLDPGDADAGRWSSDPTPTTEEPGPTPTTEEPDPTWPDTTSPEPSDPPSSSSTTPSTPPTTAPASTSTSSPTTTSSSWPTSSSPTSTVPPGSTGPSSTPAPSSSTVSVAPPPVWACPLDGRNYHPTTCEPDPCVPLNGSPVSPAYEPGHAPGAVNGYTRDAVLACHLTTGDQLPVTGMSPTTMATAAAALVMLGAILIALTRRPDEGRV